MFTKKIKTHRLKERTYGCQRERLGKGIVRDFGKAMDTLLYFKWITNKDLLYSTGNSTQYYVAAWIGRESEGKWTHVYVCLSPFAIHLKLTTLSAMCVQTLSGVQLCNPMDCSLPVSSLQWIFSSKTTGVGSISSSMVNNWLCSSIK